MGMGMIEVHRIKRFVRYRIIEGYMKNYVLELWVGFAT